MTPTSLLRYAAKLFLLALLTYGTLFYGYKYYLPTFSGHDYFEYYKMIVDPLGHDAEAPFAYRILGTGLAHLVYTSGLYYPSEIAFAFPGHDQRVFFAALLTNYLCLLLTGLVVMALVREYLDERSAIVQLVAATSLFLSFAASQFVVTGLTEGLSWLLVALGFLFYLRSQRLGVVVVLLLSIAQREVISILFGMIAAVDLVLQRRDRSYSRLVLGTAIGCFLTHLFVRVVLFPIPGYERQLRAAQLWDSLVEFAAGGFLAPNVFIIGFLSQNLAGATVLLALWARVRGSPVGSPYLPHAVCAALVLLLVGAAAGIDGNVGRILALLNPVWAVLFVDYLRRLDPGVTALPRLP